MRQAEKRQAGSPIQESDFSTVWGGERPWRPRYAVPITLATAYVVLIGIFEGMRQPTGLMSHRLVFWWAFAALFPIGVVCALWCGQSKGSDKSSNE